MFNKLNTLIFLIIIVSALLVFKNVISFSSDSYAKDIELNNIAKLLDYCCFSNETVSYNLSFIGNYSIVNNNLIFFNLSKKLTCNYENQSIDFDDFCMLINKKGFQKC